MAEGESRDLRDSDDDPPRTALTERRPKLLVIAIDGIDRDLLYDMLRDGDLPGLARFLGRDASGAFPRAHFDDRVLAPLPSNTFPAWAALFTGEPPGINGLPNNEIFLREDRELAAPGPVSIRDSTPSLLCFTEDYADDLLEVPTIYEKIRRRDPAVRVWVSMSHFHRGADRLLLAKREVMTEVLGNFLDDLVDDEEDDDILERYAPIDRGAIDALIDAIEDGDVPDVLTLYLAGNDLFTHKAKAGPDAARRRYLATVVDPKLAELHRTMAARRTLDDRYVLVVSDHGHTKVVEDDRHALGSDDEDGEREAPAVLKKAGFRVRPLEWKVPDDHDFQAVITYGGAMAYIYLADRSTCAAAGQRCDFARPPRYQEDVLAIADAFYQTTRTGGDVPAMKGSLDLVLARRPRPFAEEDEPFQVYVGDGKLEDVSTYLARHPRRGYVEVEARLRELAVGRHGERAGDVILIARDGAEKSPSRRFYFSPRYESWHGSPSRRDSEVPVILAHPGKTRRQLRALADASLGEGGSARLHHVGRMLVRLRMSPVTPPLHSAR